VGSDEVILLDTHVAIWIATGNEALGLRSRALLEDPAAENELAVSAVSFWEIALLATRGRFNSSKSVQELRADLLATRMVELPLTGPIAISAVDLKEIHGDPADRFIVATAIAHGATLMTADRALLNWRDKRMNRQDAAK
jgi:PIN domain nuclease of toxin-antitoxin system